VGGRASILQHVVTMGLIARIDDDGHLELEKSWQRAGWEPGLAWNLTQACASWLGSKFR